MTAITVKPRPQVDRLALLLITGVVFSAAWSIATADWMPHLDLLDTTVVVSILLSLVVVTRPWRPRTAHIVMILYGVIWVTLIVLDQMPDKVFGWTSLDTLRHMIVRLGEHIYVWGDAVITGGVGRDNSIFLLFLASLFWLISYIAVWNTFRQQRMWLAVAPAGVALLINTYYYGGPQSLYLLLIVYLFCVLLYAARMYTLKQEERWHFSRIRFNPEIKRDFLQIGSSIALAAVIFGTVAPNVFGSPQISDLWREISRPMRSIEESFNRLFSGLQPHGIAFANPFGRTLALLGQRNLGNELVMEVHASGGRYWQAVVYDEYTSSGWRSSDTTRLAIDPNVQYTGRYEARNVVTQTFTVYFPNNTLIFAAPQAQSLDRAAWIESFPGEANNDFAMWTAISPLGAGDSYQVISSLSKATAAQLRIAETAYPAYIREHYLQLPDTLPPHIKQLAQQIVGDAKATNAFDQASALEAWLRANIKYNEQIPAPPPGVDGVDYVLFTTQQGYCDYYASAMAVMARSLGIPARVATGYSQGIYDSQRDVYQVFQFNAHTWVEVYFPEYGWVEFEPTASQPAIDRPIVALTNSLNDPTGSSTNENLDPTHPRTRPEHVPEDIETPASGQLAAPAAPSAALITLLLVVSVTLVLAGILLGAAWAYENRGGIRHLRGSEWAFARMARMAKWLRVRLLPSQTPYEQARTLRAVMPVASEPAIDRIADLYVIEHYSPTRPDPGESRSVWRDLRWPMWWSGFKRRLPRSVLSLRRAVAALGQRLPRRR